MRGGETTPYIYDAAGNLLAEADQNNVITRYYIYGLGLLAMVTPTDDIYCYHFDAIGSTIAMTDATESTVNEYAYTSFGKIMNETGTIAQPFKFVGQHGVMTEPNGLYFMRARYYDPQVGRFVSEDPAGFGGGDINLYVYVANNPILLIDPWGLCKQDNNALRDLIRGAEFGFKAAGVVMKATAKMVAEDVALAAANYIPLPPRVAFVTGRGLSGLAISRNFYGLEEVANRVSRDIVIIRNDVFPD